MLCLSGSDVIASSFPELEPEPRFRGARPDVYLTVWPRCSVQHFSKFCSGTIGKVATGQVLWPAAIALVVGTIPGAQFGGGVSKKVNTKYLRLVIAVIIAVTGIKMWYQILSQ